MSNYYIRPNPSFDLKYEKTLDYYMVSDRNTSIVGTGDSYLEALGDFRKSAGQYLEVFDSLATRPGGIVEHLQWQREYLRERLATHPVSHT